MNNRQMGFNIMMEPDENMNNNYIYSNNINNNGVYNNFYDLNNINQNNEEDALTISKERFTRIFNNNYNTNQINTENKTNSKSKNKNIKKMFKKYLGRKTKRKNDIKNNIDYNIRTNINDFKNQRIIPNNINNIINKKEQKSQYIESYLDKTYFYQNLTNNEWKEITNFITTSLSNENLRQEDIEQFFSRYPNLYKGENNIIKLRKILNDVNIENNSFFFSFFTTNNFNINSYKKINDFIINNYYMVKPSIFEVHFFPNKYEEVHLINLISKAKNSLDIAMFTMNNKNIAEEIKNIFYKGIKLRIITDCECIKKSTSNIYSLAAIGINIKTDDSIRYYMHHKFCVIDNSVVVTGSFNWTAQAVYHNHENLLFLENKDLAMKYSQEFEKLWEEFETVVTQEIAIQKIEEMREKKIIENREKRERGKKLIINQNKIVGMMNNDNMQINNYNKNNMYQNQRIQYFNNNKRNNIYNAYQSINNENKNLKNKENNSSFCSII